MQTSRLHVSLHAFASEAAAALAAMVAAGDEIPFEVTVEGAARGGPGLYCWQPRTGEFLERHWAALLHLGSAADALAALGSLGGLDEYLATYADERRAGSPAAHDALRCFAHRVFDGAAEFELAPERFEPAFRELDGLTSSERSALVLTALLRGVGCESDDIEIAEGVLLVPLAHLEVLPPDPLWRDRSVPATVVALVPGTGPEGVGRAVAQLRDLQTALRLYAPGVALAPLAWIRGERTAWRAMPIPGGGRGDGNAIVAAAQEEELRSFVNLIGRRRPVEGPAAWALARFEAGCEREDPLAGLTDHLLALRALLEPEGPRSGRLAGRIAALCALAPERAAVTERVAHAISLEQSLIAGVPVGEDAAALAAEIEAHLRALLRDLVCGHLRPELVELADSLLHERIEEEPAGEVRIRRTRAHAEPASAPRDDLFGSLDDGYWAADDGISLRRDA
jgi:hypothetical protein